MSLETQELGRIFTEIQSEFFNDHEIQVLPVSGDPPSQYEITYGTPCTTQDEHGKITITSNHTVIISIPFGFPHFPPSCKPKSSIFHPDFDTAAICLGDFWNRERTIPELIRHIGTMLRGEVYSTENTFNEEAASWFRANSSQLPFSKPGGGPPEAEPEGTLTLALEPAAEEMEISLMDDHDFIDDFHFQKDFHEASTPPQPSEPVQAELDTGRLKQLARKRYFTKLDTELGALSADTNFPGKRDLSDRTAFALREARTLYEEAKGYENQGLSHKALECFRAVEDLVADYPGISSDISRTEQSANMLKEISTPPASPQPTGKPQSEGSKRPGEKTQESTAPGPAPSRRDNTPDERAKRPANIIFYALTGGILCILATLTYFYFTLSSHLTEARQLFSECTSSLAAKNFQAAEKTCSAALDTTQRIFLIHQPEVLELQSSIRNILDSEEMRQGLQGNVLYNKQYVPKAALATHQSLQEMKSQGDALLKASSWDQAAASFQKALELSRQIDDLNPEELHNIEQNLTYAAFRSMLSVAEGQVDKESWSEAAATLTELQGQIDKLTPRQQAEYREYVDTLLAKSRFTTLKEQAETLFSQSDWTGAAALFQEAVETGRSLSETEIQEITSLKVNIRRAELYSTIDAGNNAFASGQWNAAIEKYSLAGEILEKNSAILDQQEIEQNRKRLDRIILQSAIIRDRQLADKSKDANDGPATLSYLQKVTNTIQASGFADDPEFKKILSETLLAQQKLKDELFIEEKRQYLIDNFTALFQENYPAARPETLSAPVATFEKRLERLYLFKLQCTESGRGRPLKLIMYYTYDPNSRQWKFYSEN